MRFLVGLRQHVAERKVKILAADINIERTIRSTTKLAISGARILGHWKDKNTGDIYAFAELNLDSMDELIAKAENLSASFKQYYQQSKSANFDRFSQSSSAQQ